MWCKKRPAVIGATFAFHKRLFDTFGPLANGVDYEDQVLSLRAAALGGGLTLQAPLVRYRQGGLSAKAQRDPRSLLAHAKNKYQRQLAVYTQITQDLNTASQPHLAEGKIAKYLQKSKTALALIARASDGTPSLLMFVLRNPESPGIAWSLLKMLWVKYPRIAVALKQKI
jgi:hypothetical protein